MCAYNDLGTTLQVASSAGDDGCSGIGQPTLDPAKPLLRKRTRERTAQSRQEALHCTGPAPVNPRSCALPCLRRAPSRGKGYGLWTMRFLPKYTVIGVYTGMVLTDVEAPVPAKFARHTMKANDDGSYRIVSDPDVDVLCSVNEPDEHCFANLFLQFVRVDVGGSRHDTVYVVVYTTAHDIQPNTELLVSYGGAASGKGQHFIRDGYQPGGPPQTREMPSLSQQLTDAFQDGFCVAQQLSPVDIAYAYGAVEEDECADVRSEGLHDLEATMREMNRQSRAAAA